MTRTSISSPAWAWACAGLVALGAAGPANAQNSARERYLQERERCLSGQTHQERRTCLREAAAAYEAARRGELSRRLTEDDFRANSMARCQALPAGDQEACRARMQGQGLMRGSVEEGGIYREYREVIPAPAEAAPAAPGGPSGAPEPSGLPAGDRPQPAAPPASGPAGDRPGPPSTPQTDPRLQFSGPSSPPGSPVPPPGTSSPTQPGTVPGQIGPSTTPGMAQPQPPASGR